MLDVNSLLSGALGSFIVFILGVFYENRKEEKNRRINSRAYISCDNLQEVDISNGVGNALENHSTEKRFRIIETSRYNELVKELESMNFVAIKNIGPNLILDCNINIKLLSVEKKVDYIKVKIPLIENKEDIYICADSLNIGDVKYYVKNVEVIYKTLAQEKMKFEWQQNKDKKNNVITTNKIYVGTYELKEISSIDIPPCNWIYHNKY